MLSQLIRATNLVPFVLYQLVIGEPSCGCRSELMDNQWYNPGEWCGGLGHLLMEFTCALWPCSFPSPDMPRALHDALLLGLTDPRSPWVALATWPLDIPWPGTLSLPGAVAFQELFFFLIVYNSLLQIAWLCSRNLGLCIIIFLLEVAINSTLHLSPPQMLPKPYGLSGQVAQAAG